MKKWKLRGKFSLRQDVRRPHPHREDRCNVSALMLL